VGWWVVVVGWWWGGEEHTILVINYPPHTRAYNWTDAKLP
jgi:hypothetical protein